MPDAIFGYAERLYSILTEQAQEKIIDGNPVQVFYGSATEMFRKLDISMGYYTPVWSCLSDMGCITQLRRGHINQESVYTLNREPTEAEYLQRKTDEAARRRLTRTPDYATLSADVEAIKKMLGGIDIREALADHETRLRSLEREGKESGT